MKRLLLIVLLLNLPNQAFADSDDMKRLIGGVVGGIVLNGLENALEGCEKKLEVVTSNVDDRPTENQEKINEIMSDLKIEKQSAINLHARNLKNHGDCYKESDKFKYNEAAITKYDSRIEEWKKNKSQIANRTIAKKKQKEKKKQVFQELASDITYNDGVVELTIKQIVLDTKYKQTHLRVQLKNISEGKMLKPVTTSGKELKKTYNLSRSRYEHDFVDVPYGVIVKDSFDNRYTLEDITPKLDGSKSYPPGESAEFRINFDQLPIAKSDYINLRFLSEMTGHKRAEIKIPMATFNKISTKYEKGCFGSCFLFVGKE